MGSSFSTIAGLALFATLLNLVWDSVDKKRRGITGPTPIPLMGNTPLAMYYGVARRSEMWASLFKAHGDTFLFRGTANNMIVTKNPDNIQYFTSTNFSNYKRTHPADHSFRRKAVYELFGDGIFVSDDEVWSLQRKVATPLFKKQSLDSMKLVFHEKANTVIELLKTFAQKGTEFDIQKIFHEYTLDSFSLIGFGMDIDSLHNDVQFPFHFDRAQRLLVSLILNPFAKYFGDTKSHFTQSTSYMKEYFGDAIKNHKKEGGDDLMSKFLALKDEDGNPYPAKWLTDILINFSIAGRDTTAILLSWTVYCVAANPRVMGKIQAEIESVLKGEEPNSTNIAGITYLEWCISETLRVYPPVPFTGRFALEDDVLPDGTKVKRGDRIAATPLFLHKDEKYWPDPFEYKPERWDHPKMRHPFQYVPFYAGPMQCLGRHMALIEDHPVRPFIGAVMPAIQGIKVTISPK